MQDIIIRISTADKDIDATIDKLVQLGVVDKKNADQFKKHQKDFHVEQKKTLGILEKMQKREQRLIQARLKSTNPAHIKKYNELLKKNREAIDKVTGATKKTEKQFGVLSTVANNLGGIIAGAFAVGTIMSFGRQMVDTVAEFEKFEAVLVNTLGSKSEAQKSLAMIVDFASKTPFSVQELTGAFVKLVNQGFKPTQKEMVALGDVAASTGKTFDQLAEAVIDAQVGEMERLKEFGIRAQKEGDRVTFTFKGLKTQVDFTEEAIRDYIVSLGEAEGVMGAMAAISETTGGKISNLGDSYDQAMLSINESTGIVSTAIGGLVENMGDMLDQITLINNSDLGGFEQMVSLFSVFNNPAYAMAQEKRLKAVQALKKAYSELSPAMKQNGEVQKKLIENLTTAGIEREKINEFLRKEMIALEDSSRAKEKETEKTKVAADSIAGMKKQLQGLMTEFEKTPKGTAEFYRLRAATEALKHEIAALSETEEQRQRRIEQAAKMTEAEEKKKLDAFRKAHEEYVKAEAEKNKRIEEINKEFHASEIAMIEDETEQKVAALMLQYEEQISALDSAKDNENALIIQKTKQLEADITRVRQDGEQKRREAAQKSYEVRMAQIEQEISAYGTLFGAMTGLFEEGTAEQRTFTLAQIAFDTAAAISSLAAMSEANPANAFTFGAAGAAQYIAGLARIIGNMAAARNAMAGYKDGVIDLQGPGTGKSDSIPAWLSKGESVMTAEETKEHYGLLNAIRQKKLEDYIMKEYALKIRPEAPTKHAMDKSFVDNLVNTLGKNDFSSEAIVHTMKKLDKQEAVRMERFMMMMAEVVNNRPNRRRG